MALTAYQLGQKDARQIMQGMQRSDSFELRDEMDTGRVTIMEAFECWRMAAGDLPDRESRDSYTDGFLTELGR